MPAVKGKKTKQIETAERETVVQKTKGLNLTKVIADLGDTQIYVQQSMGELTAKLSEQVSQVETLDAAIAIKTAELQSLHGIAVTATTADDLEAQIAETQNRWVEEQNERQARWQEEDAERRKARQREDLEYTYSIQQARQKDKDIWDAQLVQRARDEKNRQEELTKVWVERENALKAQETEIVSLRAQVASFPEQIKKAEATAAAVAGGSVKREKDQEIALLRKDAETEKKIADANTASMNATIARLQNENARLQEEVKSANSRAESIAAKAVESASGRQALDALQRANEVAQQNGGGGRK